MADTSDSTSGSVWVVKPDQVVIPLPVGYEKLTNS